MAISVYNFGFEKEKSLPIKPMTPIISRYYITPACRNLHTDTAYIKSYYNIHAHRNESVYKKYIHFLNVGLS